MGVITSIMISDSEKYRENCMPPSAIFPVFKIFRTLGFLDGSSDIAGGFELQGDGSELLVFYDTMNQSSALTVWNLFRCVSQETRDSLLVQR